MNLIDRIIIGQTFRSPSVPNGNSYSWRITSVVMWSKVGTRFVWCDVQRAGKRKWRPRVFELSDITGKIGDDLRDYYRMFPALPVMTDDRIERVPGDR